MITHNKTFNTTQEAMLSCFHTRQPAISARALMSRRFPKEVLAVFPNEETGDLMEYCHLIGNPKYREMWQNSYRNELGRLAQGMPGRVEEDTSQPTADKKSRMDASL